MSTTHSHPDVQRVLFSEAELKNRCRELGEQITRDYKDTKGLVVVGILKGAFMFLSDLIRHIDLPNNIEFMSVSSYGHSTQSSGEVRVLLDLKTPIEGKDVLVCGELYSVL